MSVTLVQLAPSVLSDPVTGLRRLADLIDQGEEDLRTVVVVGLKPGRGVSCFAYGERADLLSAIGALQAGIQDLAKTVTG